MIYLLIAAVIVAILLSLYRAGKHGKIKILNDGSTAMTKDFDKKEAPITFWVTVLGYVLGLLVMLSLFIPPLTGKPVIVFWDDLASHFGK